MFTLLWNPNTAVSLKFCVTFLEDDKLLVNYLFLNSPGNCKKQILEVNKTSRYKYVVTYTNKYKTLRNNVKINRDFKNKMKYQYTFGGKGWRDSTE